MKKILNVISSYIYLSWIELDLDRYMRKLEKFTLKPAIERKFSEEILKDEAVLDTWKYITSFVIKTYSEYSVVPVFHETLEQEADYISGLFVNSFLQGAKLQNLEDLYWMFPESDYKPFFDEEQLLNLTNKNKEAPGRGMLPDNYLQMFHKFDKSFNTKFKRTFAPGLKHYIGALWYVLNSSISFVKQYKKEYHINFINDGEQRCLFNYYTLYLHHIAFTGKIKLGKQRSKLYFAAAALHPAHDDYIDGASVEESVVQAIYDKIRGKSVDSSSLNLKIKPVLDLLDVVYRKYPPQNNPLLVDIFCQINYWQNESRKQKGLCSTEDLLKISFMKGGYAFALYGYLLMGNMKTAQFRRFYSMGAVFQIMDDLHDIKEDIADGINTVWTQYITKGLNADPSLFGVAAVQREFERIIPNYKSFRRPVFIRRLDLFGLRFDILKFYLLASEHFSKDIKLAIQRCLPISVDFITNYRYVNGLLYDLKSTEEFELALSKVKDIVLSQVVKDKHRV